MTKFDNLETHPHIPDGTLRIKKTANKAKINPTGKISIALSNAACGYTGTLLMT